MDTCWDLQGCAAIEALRLGVVNQYVARYITYGRDREIAALQNGIVGEPDGSCQVVIGRYGIGKTHLCEVLAARLETAGYAVARIELGSSSGRAENPDAILASLCRSLSLRMEGMRVQGASDIACWVPAVMMPSNEWGRDRMFLEELYIRLPGKENVIRRYNEIRERYTAIYDTSDFTHLLVSGIPSTMTACNLACAQLNRLAHTLGEVGVKGLVILLDEAERSTWAYTPYRVERAEDMMLGLALTAANASTHKLKHYANDRWRHPYRPLAPSRIHSIFLFTDEHGLPMDISRQLKIRPHYLEHLGEEELKGIIRKVKRLHCTAYNWKANGLALKEYSDAILECEIRPTIRRLIAALDRERFHSRG